MRVALLHDQLAAGARADELDVLVQMRAIADALHTLGHHTECLPFTLQLGDVSHSLRKSAPDLVCNLVEAVGGHGRLIYLAPALLDSLGIPYTGAHTEAMFLTSNKVLTKRWLRAAGLPTPVWFTQDDLAGLSIVPRGRYLIKSVWEEASVGLDEDSLVEVEDAAALQKEIDRRRDRLGGEGFAEEYVDGREFNLSLLAVGEGQGGEGGACRVLPAAEIEFVDYAPDKPRIVGYRAKWVEDSFEYRHTQRTFAVEPADRPLVDELVRLAQAAWRHCSLRGYARVDFRVDAVGRPWILEINANPCLSPDAGFAAAAAEAGIGYKDLVAEIVADALRQTPK